MSRNRELSSLLHGGSIRGKLGINGGSVENTAAHVVGASTTAGLGKSSANILITNTDGGAFDQRAEILFKNVGQVTSAISSSYTSYSQGEYGGALILATKDHTDTSLQERFRITSNGRIGIGTIPGTDPSTYFDITRVGSRTSDLSFQIGAQRLHSVAVNSQYSGFSIHTNRFDGEPILAEASSWYMDLGGRNFDGAKADCFRIARASSGSSTYTSSLVIDSVGNIGIGTNNPDDKLDVEGNLRLGLRSWKTGTPRKVASLSFFSGGSAGERSNPVASIEGWDEYVSGGNYAGSLRFFTQDVTGSIERVRITSGGRLLIGTTSESGLWTASSNNPGIAMRPTTLACQNIDTYNLMLSKPTGYTNSNLAGFFVNNVTVGTITTNGNSTSYNTTSDYRLKINVQPLTGASERIKLLSVHRFNWENDPTGPMVDGFLAHEAQAVVPESVAGEKDATETVVIQEALGKVLVNGEVVASGVSEDSAASFEGGEWVETTPMITEERPVYQGIDQSKLVPLLTAALQEALAEIEALKARLDQAGL